MPKNILLSTVLSSQLIKSPINVYVLHAEFVVLTIKTSTFYKFSVYTHNDTCSRWNIIQNL